MKLIKVLIADDHRIVLDGLRAMLEGVPELELIGTAENGREAVHRVKLLNPDVLLIDMDMPEMNGLEASKLILKECSNVKIIMLTMHNEPSLIRRVLQSGLHGFMLKTSDRTDLIQAIFRVYAGGTEIAETVPELGRPGFSVSDNEEERLLKILSDREIEVLKHIAQGMSNKEIGDMLHISHRTVDTHRTNIARKLEVHNIAGMIRFAMKAGLT
jgi:DNA-binding NarL/FixJ family response regulator